MKKIIGKVSVEEKNEILALYERRNGLTELAKIVNNDDALYEKLIADMGATATKFQNWWNEMSAKYQWESAENGHWEINFDTCEIALNF
ncbi:MAG: CXXX repeat peptide modification system protein [Dysgonamonadaceae bacterium]|jgi:CXXX repeat modification system protein|nr:CXXX repeat peptide modification system protein [Dysgonamonadaceae bacterium]